ncbi:MAG: penicillin-insensitive murein endopeptidase [Sandaracinaceae bacterium]
MSQRPLHALFCVLLGLSLSSGALADAREHTVARGETLSTLAETYGVSVARLRELNGLSSDHIEVGQRLRVEQEPMLRYRTVPGDTLGCIASRFGVPASTILEDNPGVSRRSLGVGVRLRLRGGHDPREGAGPVASEVVRIRAGDTLSAVAARYGVTLSTLTAANPDVDPARLAVGGELTVPVSRSVHEVQRGETMGRIARRRGITLAALRALNPDVQPARLRVGEELVVPGGPPSVSVGAPFCGFVRNSHPLGRHAGYVLRNPARSFGTARTVSRIQRAFGRAYRPGSDPRVRVHDLSLEGGGPIDDHRSHQSGRDVDITYYVRGNACDGRQGCPLARVDPDGLDVRRQWRLLREWLRRDEAEAIYIDYALQAPLYREARRRGATRAQLGQWFQYPRGRFARDGVVRHFPNHRDHLHVRFACAPGEPECR